MWNFLFSKVQANIVLTKKYPQNQHKFLHFILTFKNTCGQFTVRLTSRVLWSKEHPPQPSLAPCQRQQSDSKAVFPQIAYPSTLLPSMSLQANHYGWQRLMCPNIKPSLLLAATTVPTAWGGERQRAGTLHLRDTCRASQHQHFSAVFFFRWSALSRV